MCPCTGSSSITRHQHAAVADHEKPPSAPGRGISRKSPCEKTERLKKPHHAPKANPLRCAGDDLAKDDLAKEVVVDTRKKRAREDQHDPPTSRTTPGTAVALAKSTDLSGELLGVFPGTAQCG